MFRVLKDSIKPCPSTYSIRASSKAKRTLSKSKWKQGFIVNTTGTPAVFAEADNDEVEDEREGGTSESVDLCLTLL